VLVDQSEFFRNLIEPVLSEIGYRVIAFSGPQDALEHLNAGGPADVILSDLDMPEMDGFQFAETLRADEAFGTLPIIAVSGGPCTPQKVPRARVAGFTDYVAKFDRAGLVAALTEFDHHIQGKAA